VNRQRPPRDDILRLYESHGRLLLAYGCSLLRDAAAAEDAVHQVFARLLRGDLTIQGAPAAYLCRAVRNVALNDRRGRSREAALDDHAAWLEAPPGLEETAFAIEQALTTLPPEQREVVVLHLWGQMTFHEIGDALEISPNTAASRYRYGLAKLRDVLKPLGPRDEH
jgi:RNA polymerase sigma-70 factor, ECF subfamily